METAAIETAKLLGTGSVQIVLALGLVFFAVVAAWALKKLLDEVKECAKDRVALHKETLSAQNRVADAMDNNTRVTQAALDALKQR